MASYLAWLQPVAGDVFSLHERVWLEEAAIAKFLADPVAVGGWFADYEKANRAYRIERDSARREVMIAERALGIHCYLATSNATDDARTLDVIFRANPVVAADCEAGEIERRDDVVLAEADGFTLAERDVRIGRDWLAFLLGRKLLPGEAARDREDVLALFRQDPAAFMESIREIENLFADHQSRELAYLKQENHRKLIIETYCREKREKNTRRQAFGDLLDVGEDVLLVDCAQGIMTMRSDIDAALSALDFLASLAGLPPFTPDERARLHDDLADDDVTYAKVDHTALLEWWSMIGLTEKKIRRSRPSGQRVQPCGRPGCGCAPMGRSRQAGGFFPGPEAGAMRAHGCHGRRVCRPPCSRERPLRLAVEQRSRRFFDGDTCRPRADDAGIQPLLPLKPGG